LALSLLPDCVAALGDNALKLFLESAITEIFNLKSFVNPDRVLDREHSFLSIGERLYLAA
jgi:hypothetical protein